MGAVVPFARYPSGRSLEQGMARSVVEGGILYVTPEGLARMHQAIHDYNTGRPNPDPDHAAYAALKAVGLLDAQIGAALGRGFKVVVDYDLED
jgi:hypothetical protein